MNDSEGYGLESHYSNDRNPFVSGIYSKVFGDVSLAARFSVPNQYRSNRLLELQAVRQSFIDYYVVRLGVSLVFRIGVDDHQVSTLFNFIQQRIVEGPPFSLAVGD
jgi:hypothetical protein